MTAMHVAILGPPYVEVNDGRVVSITSVRAAALLWFMAAQPDRRFTREELVALLWTDVDRDDGLRRLNTTLTRLRQALPVCPIQANRRLLEWAATGGITVDATLLLSDLKAAIVSAPTETRERLQVALRRWRGRFLEGFSLVDATEYEDWVSQQRREWDRRALEATERLIRLDAAAGDWPMVSRHVMQALRIDPWRESLHRWMMIAQANQGDRGAALNHFYRWADQVRQDLDSEPDPSTIALAEAIRKGTAVSSEGLSPTLPEPVPPQRETVPSPLPVRPTAWELPWVGRAAELERLAQGLRSTGRQRSRLLVVEGPAGMGKTRLVGTAVADAEDLGPVLRAACYETTRLLPYAPWLTVLRQALSYRGLDALDRPWRQAIGWLLPEVAQEAERLPSFDFPGLQHQIGEAVKRYCQVWPPSAVVVLDDWQWADEASWNLLTLLMESDLGPGPAIVVALRPEALQPGFRELLDRWRREGKAELIALHPFTPVEVEELVHAVRPQEGSQGVDHLYRETAGHPLFLAEWLRAWQSGGLLRLDEPLRPVPESLQRTVASWLGHLSPAARRLAEGLAGFSEPVAFELVQRVVRLSEAAALEAWNELLARGVAREEEGLSAVPWGQWGSGVVVALTHDLVRAVLREAMPKVRWAALHRRVVETVMTRGGATASDPLVGWLVYHASEAGMWEEAAQWSLAAADATERVGAYADTVCWLEKAHQFLQRLPPTAERQRECLLLRLRWPWFAWYAAPDEGRTVIEAMVPDVATVEDLEIRWAYQVRRIEGLVLEGKVDQAGETARQLLRDVEASQRPDWSGIVRLRLAQLHTIKGEIWAALDGYAAAAPLLQHLPPPTYAECLGSWAAGLAAAGQFPAAHAKLAAIDSWPASRGHHTVALLAAFHTLRVYTQAESWEAAAEIGCRLLADLHASGHHLSLAYMTAVFTGLPLAATGDVAGATALLQGAIDQGSRFGIQLLADRAWAYLAEVLAWDGQWTLTERTAREGLRLARRHGYRAGEALNLRMVGVALVGQGHRQPGIALLEKAAEQLTFLGARAEAGRCWRVLDGLSANSEAAAALRALWRH